MAVSQPARNPARTRRPRRSCRPGRWASSRPRTGGGRRRRGPGSSLPSGRASRRRWGRGRGCRAPARRGAPSPRRAVANTRSGAARSSSSSAASRPLREERGGGRQVDADPRARVPGERDRREPASPERVVEQRVGREVEGVGAAEPGRAEVPGRSLRAAPRSVTNERWPLPSTTTPMRPVRSPATRTARTVTPSPVSAATRTRPVASRPTAQISVLRAPILPSQRAAVAADPPCRSWTLPVTSLPARARGRGRRPRRARGRRARRRTAGTRRRRGGGARAAVVDSGAGASPWSLGATRLAVVEPGA